MACNIAKGRTDNACLDSLGGIKNIYFVNWAGQPPASGTIQGNATLTGEEITGMGALFDAYKYELRGASNIDETNTKDIAAGTSIFEASGTVTLKKQDKDTQAQLMLLSKGRPIVITESWAAQGATATFRLYGLHNGCDVTVNSASGADINEFNGYTLTVASRETNMAYYLASSLIAVGKSTSGFDIQTTNVTP